MKRIFKKLGELLLEEKFCPYCKIYVKVKTVIKRRGEQKVEVKICNQCGRIIEETIQREEED